MTLVTSLQALLKKTRTTKIMLYPRFLLRCGTAESSIDGIIPGQRNSDSEENLLLKPTCMTSKTFGNYIQKKENVIEAVQKSRTKTIIGMEAVTTLHEKRMKTPKDLNAKQRK